LGGESKRKEPRRVDAYIPPTNPQENGLENSPRKTPRKGSENHQNERTGTAHPSLDEP
jgi:hypothetical protein